MNKKVILAYSGGLDTSVILKWLIDKGYDVICYVADVGQEDDFNLIKNKALTIGASKVYVDDLKAKFVKDYIFPWLKTNALYEGRYFLGTALARPLIAQKQTLLAQKENTNIIAHGATGKGNDQIRFELTARALMPEIEVIAPWRMTEFSQQFQGRTDMISYANAYGIEVSAKKKYSMDANLMHISYESGELEDPETPPSEEMFIRTTSPQNAPDTTIKISIVFEQGIPMKIIHGDITITEPLGLFQYLNNLAANNGIGRIDIVESRVVGMKSRGVYETPAATVLLYAHRDLETLTIDREVLALKEMLTPKIAELIYQGLWFSPEMEFLMKAINHSQEKVSGTVHLNLYKGNCYVTARSSQNSLYDKDLASMDKLGNYDQKDAEGFIKIQSLRLSVKNKA